MKNIYLIPNSVDLKSPLLDATVPGVAKGTSHFVTSQLSHETLAVMHLQRGPPTAENEPTTHAFYALGFIFLEHIDESERSLHSDGRFDLITETTVIFDPITATRFG
jgi:hypothetical protein